MFITQKKKSGKKGKYLRNEGILVITDPDIANL